MKVQKKTQLCCTDLKKNDCICHGAVSGFRVTDNWNMNYRLILGVMSLSFRKKRIKMKKGIQ